MNMMKKKVIILFIIILTLSLTGLIYIQLYWIRNALAVKEVQFDRGVSEAINSAVYKYNKIELAVKLFSQSSQDQQFNFLFNILDSLNRHHYQQIFSTDKYFKDHRLDNKNLYLGKKTDINFEKDKTYHVFDTSVVFSAGYDFAPSYGYIQRNNIRESENELFEIFLERTRIINDLFDDLFFKDCFSFNLSHDFNKAMLDSLIRRELLNNGIITDYEFGIYNPIYKKFICETSGKQSKKLLKKGYVFSLFPNSVFSNPEYLLLYFPDQKKYLLSQLNIMMSTSTVFIFIIIFSIVFIIFTIIRQKKLSVMKSDFINNMTHELKTPISTISLACQALNDKDVRKTERLYQSYITMIEEENKRLGMMTEKVLQTSLIDKGKLKLNITKTDIHEIISNAIDKISIQINNRHGVIITKLNAENSCIKADKMHMTNVIFNLLDNAIKYTTKTPEIIITTSNNNEGILISVEDNGVGISKSYQKKLFDNLCRVSTGNIHDVKGFGLGLSYVKNIIELHKGNIYLESEPKKGSKFTIFMPCVFNNQNNNENYQKSN